MKCDFQVNLKMQCKFFAQGYCRFGDNCHFVHSQGNGPGHSPGSVFSRPPFHANMSSNVSGNPAFGTSSVFGAQNKSGSVFGKQLAASTDRNSVFGDKIAVGSSPHSVFGRLDPSSNATSNHNQSVFSNVSKSASVFGGAATSKLNGIVTSTPAAPSQVGISTHLKHDLSTHSPSRAIEKESTKLNALEDEALSIVKKSSAKMLFGQVIDEGAPDVRHLTFSKTSDLDETEIELFENAEFEFGFIPVKAPPRDLCH